MAEKVEPTQTFNPVDPVCGKRMTARHSNSLRVSEYKKRRYYFCSEGCQHTFDSQTEHFRLRELARAGGLMRRGGARWGLA